VKQCAICGKALEKRAKRFCREHSECLKRFTGRDYVRELVRIRDNQTCQGCSEKWKPGERKLDVHHIKGFCGKNSRGYDNIKDMDTLITLCHRCHYNRHDFSQKLRQVSYASA